MQRTASRSVSSAQTGPCVRKHALGVEAAGETRGEPGVQDHAAGRQLRLRCAEKSHRAAHARTSPAGWGPSRETRPAVGWGDSKFRANGAGSGTVVEARHGRQCGEKLHCAAGDSALDVHRGGVTPLCARRTAPRSGGRRVLGSALVVGMRSSTPMGTRSGRGDPSERSQAHPDRVLRSVGSWRIPGRSIRSPGRAISLRRPIERLRSRFLSGGSG